MDESVHCVIRLPVGPDHHYLEADRVVVALELDLDEVQAERLRVLAEDLGILDDMVLNQVLLTGLFLRILAAN